VHVGEPALLALAARQHGVLTTAQRDRRRDAALQAAGCRVVRITWRQITQEPHVVVAQLATLLQAS
jgi:very-short-patch-repair endonuclease